MEKPKHLISALHGDLTKRQVKRNDCEDKEDFDPFATYVVPKVGIVERWRRRVRDAPENIRLASQSAWRGRERGLAVVAGVF